MLKKFITAASIWLREKTIASRITFVVKSCRTFFVLISTLLIGQGSLAEVYVSDRHSSALGCQFILVIRGEIKADEQLSLLDSIRKIQSNDPRKNCFPEIGEAQLIAQLDSPGGNVLAAIEMGRILRKHKIEAIVPFNSTCASSCVLVLAGAVIKRPYGKVGIHRPYMEQGQADSTMDSIRKRQDFIRREIRQYLNEVDVSSELLDRMLSIPSDEIRYLTEAELKALRLFGKDASFEEYEVTLQAEIYSITNGEYRRRSAFAKRVCAKGSEEQICLLSVLLDVPLQEAARRDKLSEECLDIGHGYKYLQCLKITFSGRPYPRLRFSLDEAYGVPALKGPPIHSPK